MIIGYGDDDGLHLFPFAGEPYAVGEVQRSSTGIVCPAHILSRSDGEVGLGQILGERPLVHQFVEVKGLLILVLCVGCHRQCEEDCKELCRPAEAADCGAPKICA